MKHLNKYIYLLGSILFFSLNMEAQTIELHMSTQPKEQVGNTSLSQYSSFNKILEQITQLRSQGNINPINVWVAPGIYELKEPLHFTTAHNKKKDGTITFRPTKKGNVVLSGGSHITDWHEIEPNHWVADLPDVKGGNWYFRQLFAGHKRLTRARTPNKGFLTTKGALSLFKNRGELRSVGQAEKNNPADYWLSRCGFAYSADDIRYWDDWQNAEILTLHSWESSWQAIQSIDTVKKNVYFTSPCRYPVGAFGQAMRYRIENIQEALDQVGEWFLDKEHGQLHLLTSDGEDPRLMEIHAPRLNRILEVAGDENNKVANISFENIDFQYTAYSVGLYDIAPNWPAEIQKGIPYFPSDIRHGFTGAQAAPTAGSSLKFTYADNIKFEQCGMRHLGAIAVRIAEGCRAVQLNGCEIADTGAGGVYIGFDVRLVEDAGIPRSDAPTENVVSNCLINSLGHVHPAAVGVWLAQTSNNQIVNNEISYVSYSGVSLGWTWGFEPNYTQNNYIARNHIHHTAQVLGDAAGIYSLGDCTGSVYDGNYIDQIYKGEGVHGVVDAMGFDECSSKIAIRNNVVGKISGKVASFGRRSSPDLQTWENNNFDMNISRPVFDNKSAQDPAQFTANVRFVPVSTFINLSGWLEQRWLARKNGSTEKDGFYGLLIQGKQAVAYLNIGGGRENVHQIVSENVVNDDQENTATLSYDGRIMRFYFNERLVGEKLIEKKRTPSKGKLEIAPISANSLRNGIQELLIVDKAILPNKVNKKQATFVWTAPAIKLTVDKKKIIREAGPDKKYYKRFVSALD